MEAVSDKTSCWSCGEEIMLPPDPPKVPAYVKRLRPRKLLCVPCKERFEEQEREAERLGSVWAWGREDILENPSRALALIGVPQHFLGATLEQSPDLPVKGLGELRSWADSPSGILVLHGPAGAGKTWVAVGILRAVLLEGVKRLGECRFVTEAGYKDALRWAYQNGQGDVPTRMLPPTHPRRVPFLVFDDLGATRLNEWSIGEVARLFEERHAAELPTIVTANLSLEQIGTQLDPRLSSRLAEGRQVFTFPNRDLRLDGSLGRAEAEEK